MVEFCLPLITDYSNPTIISPESSIRWVRPPLKNQLTGGSRILLYPVNTLLSDCGFFFGSSPAVEENLDRVALRFGHSLNRPATESHLE